MSDFKNPNVKTKAESGKPKAEGKVMFNFKGSMFKEKPQPLLPTSSEPRRATPNDETTGIPEYFPNYFKTVQNSRVSFKGVNLCSFKNHKFETYWTYDEQLDRHVKQTATGF